MYHLSSIYMDPFSEYAKTLHRIRHLPKQVQIAYYHSIGSSALMSISECNLTVVWRVKD